MIRYILNFLIGIDQLANAILNGDPDETLSARAWRTEQDGKIFGRIFRPLIDILLFFDPNHCYTSYVAEVNRKQQPSHYRKLGETNGSS